MWGCFYFKDALGVRREVFPTHVGVFLGLSSIFTAYICLPHACGGVSLSEEDVRLPLESSPRMWGCFCLMPCRKPGKRVFPTHVGVFLFSAWKKRH